MDDMQSLRSLADSAIEGGSSATTIFSAIHDSATKLTENTDSFAQSLKLPNDEIIPLLVTLVAFKQQSMTIEIIEKSREFLTTHTLKPDLRLPRQDIIRFKLLQQDEQQRSLYFSPLLLILYSEALVTSGQLGSAARIVLEEFSWISQQEQYFSAPTSILYRRLLQHVLERVLISSHRFEVIADWNEWIELEIEHPTGLTRMKEVNTVKESDSISQFEQDRRVLDVIAARVNKLIYDGDLPTIQSMVTPLTYPIDVFQDQTTTVESMDEANYIRRSHGFQPFLRFT